MKKPPFYKFCLDERLETHGMTPEIFGCYHFLLTHYCKAKSFPDNIAELAVIARYSPAAEFGKVWKRLEPHLTGRGISWLNKQLKIDEEYRESQREKAQKPRPSRRKGATRNLPESYPERPNNLDIVNQDQPKVNQNVPEASAKMDYVKLEQPKVSRELAGAEPDNTSTQGASQSISDSLAEPQPPVSRIEAEPEPEILTIKTMETDNQIVARETREDFDVLAAWEKFSATWPQENLATDLNSKTWFWKYIDTAEKYKSLVTAAERYLESLNGWIPLDFIVWTEQWPAWEYPK